MVTTFSRRTRFWAIGVLLAVGAGCQSYGGKPVEIALQTNPAFSNRPEVAWVVPIEVWSKSLSDAGYSWPDNPPPPGFTPKNGPDNFDQSLVRYVVQGGPPNSSYVETPAMPYQSIFLLKINNLAPPPDDKYYWMEIKPSYNGDNNFTLGIPDANGSNNKQP